MNTNSSGAKYILIGLGIVLLAGIFIYLYNRSKSTGMVINGGAGGVVSDINKTCFDLPTSSDPAVFGPAYWKAFASLAHQIPCEGCRGYAEKFISFFHDVINKKLGAPLYDQKNYDYVLQTIMIGKF